MNIYELNSYVRQRAGSPSAALLSSADINLLILQEISLRQSQIIAAGKPLRAKVNTKPGPLARKGYINTRATGKLTVEDGVPAEGQLLFLFRPDHNETININGRVLTFKVVPILVEGEPDEIFLLTGDSPAMACQRTTNFLNLSTFLELNQATYENVGSLLRITYKNNTAYGNFFTIDASSNGNVDASGTSLQGGGFVIDGETIVINGYTMRMLVDQTEPSLNANEIFIWATHSREQVAQAIAERLDASSVSQIAEASYTANGFEIDVESKVFGTGGNAITLANSQYSNITASGVTLTGGATYHETNEPPDFVRLVNSDGDGFTVLPIVNDIDALQYERASGRQAILFYGDDLAYELAFEPHERDSLEFWWDTDISNLFAISITGTRLPDRFDYAIGDACAIKALAVVANKDPSKEVFVRLQQDALQADLLRWELLWNQFLYQSQSAGMTAQRQRWQPGRTRVRRPLLY